jgi:hypothetical protein
VSVFPGKPPQVCHFGPDLGNLQDIDAVQDKGFSSAHTRVAQEPDQDARHLHARFLKVHLPPIEDLDKGRNKRTLGISLR